MLTAPPYMLDPRDPLLHSERTQGFAADPDYWKGEVFAYVGSIQNLKDLKDRGGYLAQKKQRPPRTRQYDYAWGPSGVLGRREFFS